MAVPSQTHDPHWVHTAEHSPAPPGHGRMGTGLLPRPRVPVGMVTSTPLAAFGGCWGRFQELRAVLHAAEAMGSIDLGGVERCF